MDFRTTSICFVGIATLGIARFVTLDHHKSEKTSPMRPTKAARASAPLRVSHDEMLWMSPDDWKKRFESDPTSRSPQTRKAVTRLSADLQQLIATGTDPQGDEARVYTDAILALLASKWEE